MSAEEWTLMVHAANILNSNDRKHFQATKPIKSNLKAMGAVQQRALPRYERVRMDVEVAYPPESTPDAANLHPTLKAYVDGMTSPTGKRVKELGFLQDDSDKFFSGPFIEWSGHRSGKPGWYVFRIRLTPLDPWVQPPRPDWL